MPAQLSALRGPILNSTYNSQVTDSGESLVYIKDALIILDGDNIINFGPTDTLESQLTDEILVEYHNECRFIKSVTYS